MTDDSHDTDEALDKLVHSADLDGLVRMIDDRCSTRDWEGLLRVRNRARNAVKTGRQLWPAATLAEYRLALIGPVEFVAEVLDEADGLSGQFTTGPLTEVAAQHHSWLELQHVLVPSPRAAFVAHERVIRGEAVEGSDLPPVLELPTILQPWEPVYEVAQYADNGAEFPCPELPDNWESIETVGGAEVLDDDVDLAVRQLIEPWIAGSNGQAETVCVNDGDIRTALGALGVRTARITPLNAPQALSWIAWAGASGGAHGRRRGAASGRFGAWWLLAAFGDMLNDWPIEPDMLGAFANELDWYRWDAFEPTVGWTLQIAVSDPAENVAWAITASDAV